MDTQNNYGRLLMFTTLNNAVNSFIQIKLLFSQYTPQQIRYLAEFTLVTPLTNEQEARQLASSTLFQSVEHDAPLLLFATLLLFSSDTKLQSANLLGITVNILIVLGLGFENLIIYRSEYVRCSCLHNDRQVGFLWVLQFPPAQSDGQHTEANIV